jgi:hypothetical protein
MAKGAKGSGEALLYLACLLVVGALFGPILLFVYYTRGPILTTTQANCTLWPEPLPPSASSNTVSTRTCMFSRVNITAPMPEGWKDLGYSQRTEGLTTDEAWQNTLNNNYVFLGNASEMRMRVHSTNNSSSFVCYIFWEYRDLRPACARVAKTCSEDCKWAAPEGYNPRTRSSTSIDWTLYANKKRAAVFMTPQNIDPSLSVDVKNWGIGLTVLLVSFVMCAANWEEISKDYYGGGALASVVENKGDPADWEEKNDENSGKSYWYNTKTGESSWTKP